MFSVVLPFLALDASDTAPVVGIAVGALVVGALAGFFLCRWLVKKELKENPPINAKMIRAMFLSMGRKPSESQIQAVMRSMEEANKTGSYKSHKNK